ncbi:transposase, partial [Candidatus Paracaedibacter symbiosus]|uniref:transposase n=1 Tax=Candidatus Paracaedibacter symbiosus TaxID=244582 RepID=UPI0012EC75B3
MTSSKIDTIHVITSVQRLRRWSVFEKKIIVEETDEDGKNVSYVARKHGMPLLEFFLWRRK